jgi:hypothetical protein
MIASRSFSSLFLMLLLFSCHSFSQELIPPKLKLSVTSGAEQDPYRLVHQLTAGKDRDKDKFDAIFSWVAEHIHYDYATYLSPRGAALPQLKRILQTKSGICVDYAFLMDTLCKIAGIQNISVYGYVKDDLFDVGDSLYIDNHAWNAVKLDNYWYVYDVTWSAGRYHLEFRRLGKWILNVQNKLFKTKSKSLTFKPPHKADCGKKFTATYQVLSWWRFRLLKLLGRIPVRVHWIMDKNINMDFYLVNPEVMAVTHIPDDPRWSLTADYPSIRAFEFDPKYHDLEDTLYKRQVRTGRYCGECDNWFRLDDLTKEKQMKHNTWEFNHRNHFAPFIADYNVATIFYNRSLPLDDSTTKIQHIDSALAYLNMARDDLRNASRDVNTECKLLRVKNAKKMKLLLDENRGHASFSHTISATTNKSTSAMKKFIARTRVTELRLKNGRDKLKKLYVKTNPYNNKDNVIKMQDAFLKKTAIVDSLSSFSELSRVQYSDMLEQLARNMYSKDSVLDSLIVPFTRCTFYRKYFLLDNYKKKIIEDRKKISPMKTLYATDLKNSVYLLSDSVANLGMQIFRALDKRTQYVQESGILLNVLVNENMVGKDSLKLYVNHYDAVLKEEICWLTTGSSQLQAVIKGYKRMLNRQKYMEEIIRWENRAELKRYRIINGETTWRKKKLGGIPTNNLRVTSRKKRTIANYKKEYLKKLKDERRKKREQGR